MFVRRFKTAAIAPLFFLAACSDGMFNPNQNKSGTVQLALRPQYNVSGAFAAADINLVRLTITVLPSGPVFVVDRPVDPNATSWDLPVDVPPNSELSVLVELINVAPGGAETVEFSGILPVIRVTSGPQPTPPAIQVFPGPPGNLGITSVAISPRDQTVLEGASLNLTAAVTGGTNPRVFWSSSNTTVATVDASGVVRAVRPGTATITAQAGPRSDNINVTVGARAARVEITPANVTLTSLDQEVVFTGRVLDSRNEVVPGVSITWSIADATIASQGAPGVFRALKNGRTTVTASAIQGGSTVTGTTELVVEQRALSIALTPASRVFEALGATQQFTVEARDANGRPVAGTAISWSSTNTAVATVNASGLVTAVGVGNASIIAQSGTASARAEVIVRQRAASITVTPSDATLTFLGETVALSAQVRDAQGNVMNVPVRWSARNPNIVNVNPETGVAFAVGDGTGVIFAEAEGGVREAISIEVRRVPRRVVFDPATLSLSGGQTQAVIASLADEGGSPMPTSGPITWSSTNTAVATVTTTGVVRGVSTGIAEIVVFINGIEGRLPVTVSGNAGPSVGLSIVPASHNPFPGNCFPFGGNTNHQFMGFIYRDVPPFTMQVGDKIAFDLAATNFEPNRRNIFFAIANKNPTGDITVGSGGARQDVRATSWHQVVSDANTPENPHGNTVFGDYELVYTAEAAFSFPGGGFIIGFQSSPPAAFADPGCEQVLAFTNSNDESGKFYLRFLQLPNLTLGPLDVNNGLSQETYIGGVKIYPASSAPGRPVTVIQSRPAARRPAMSPFAGVPLPDGTVAGSPILNTKPQTQKR